MVTVRLFKSTVSYDMYATRNWLWRTVAMPAQRRNMYGGNPRCALCGTLGKIMHIQVGHAYAKVEGATAAQEAWLSKFLRFCSTSHRGVEQSHPLYTRRNAQFLFPAGLYGRVVKALREEGVDVSVILRPVNAVATPYEPKNGKPLYPHQKAAVEAILAAPRPRGIIRHATGTGKGTLIAYLCGLYAQSNVCVIVTSQRLAREMRERIKDVTGETPGIVGAGFCETTTRVVVAVSATLGQWATSGKHQTFFNRFAVVLGDEVHGAAGDGYYRALLKFQNAGVRLGLSATHDGRSDGRTVFIHAVFGPVLHQYDMGAATRDGILAAPTLRMPTVYHRPYPIRGTYADWEREFVANNVSRNAAIVRAVEAAAKPAIVFVRLEEHACVLGALLTAAGVENAVVHGRLEARALDKSLRDLELCTLPVLVSTPLLRQGVDIPAVRTVINAAAMKAVIDTIQKVGRGSRKAASKNSFTVVDIRDVGCGCAKPNQHTSCRWFESHTDERCKAYAKYGYAMSPL
ncbi:MAG: hypothetical protein E6Q97_07440 [Desulfurellales bacterium]|nr:MAG: hypothetical protein E6Q97_07440 [Desulfurellales bacterium]